MLQSINIVLPKFSAEKIATYEEWLAKYEGEDRVVSSLELRKILDKTPAKEYKFFSKFNSLDKLLDGFETGELIVVSGKTKSGKTQFCISMTKNFAEQNIKCLWFSYELTPRHFIARFPELPLFYLPLNLAGRDASWIEKKIWEAKVKYDCRVIFIDHLGFLSDNENMGSKRIEIDTIVRKIKTIAIKHNVLIFLLWHNRKAPFLKKKTYEETEEDLKESSGVAQDSDAVIIIRRVPMKVGREEDWNSGLGQVSVAVARRSGVMRKSFLVKLQDGFFQEVEEEIPNIKIEKEDV